MRPTHTPHPLTLFVLATGLLLVLPASCAEPPPCDCAEAVRAYHDCYDAGGNVDDCDEPARWVREACLGDEEGG